MAKEFESKSEPAYNTLDVMSFVDTRHVVKNRNPPCAILILRENATDVLFRNEKECTSLRVNGESDVERQSN